MSELVKVCHVNLASGYRGGERQTQFLIEQCLQSSTYSTFAVTRKNRTFSKKLSLLNSLTVFETEHALLGHRITGMPKFDIIHAHDAKGAHWAYIHYLLTKTPYIITRRVMHYLNSNIFTRAVYKNAARNIGNCGWIVDSLVDYGLDNIRLVPSTSDFFPNTQPENKDKDNGSIRLLLAGALVDHHKGQSTAIKALSILPNDYQLTLMGDGPDKDSLHSLINELGLSRRVNIIPWNDDFNNLYGKYDIFLMPSNHEGAGSILIDIMRLRLPIIASEVGGIPDLVINNTTGLLTPANDPDTLANKIILLKNNDLKDSLIKAAYLNSLDYAPKEMFKSYDKIYKEVLTK